MIDDSFRFGWLTQFGSLDPNNTGLLNQEERFSEIIKEFELQCRVSERRSQRKCVSVLSSVFKESCLAWKPRGGLT